MSEFNLSVTQTGIIQESKDYFEAKADSIVTVGTNIEGDQLVTLIFLNNYPVVVSEEGVLNVNSIEKRRVAAITLGQGQAKKFYESLKSIFESE
ncbi:hypothetical protein [Rahnella contaminans]|uniref:hypothetical protein n=1 Tax=Rahnella contaminans TaxID=2703882 RepID=UPI0023D9AAFE|nr:hypothetical protein [Rahnella contaminans]MDF1895063.1 hypothetical protein [Rahnella contaminans]